MNYGYIMFPLECGFIYSQFAKDVPNSVLSRLDGKAVGMDDVMYPGGIEGFSKLNDAGWLLNFGHKRLLR